ncbi:MAG: response regulator [Chromatiales bacterium]|nr:response regulator [Chromatiales bacterium]
MVSASIVHAFASIQQATENDSPFHTIIFDYNRFEISPAQFVNCLLSEPSLKQPNILALGNSQTGAELEALYASGNIKHLTTPVDKTQLFTALHIAPISVDSRTDVVNISDHYTPPTIRQPLEILLATASNKEKERLKRMLGRHKHQVFCVSSGTETLDALDSHHFDLAIIDTQLPDISGLEAIKIYRFSRLDQPWAPFIALIDNPTTSEIKELEHAGLSTYISKPIDQTLLLKAIEKVVAHTSEEEMNEAHSSYLSAPASSADKLHLDYQRLAEIEELGNSPHFLKTLVKQYESDNERTLSDMEEAIIHSDFNHFHDLGHRLRDCAGNIGALRLYQLSVRSIRLKERDFLAESHHLLDEIQDAYRESLLLLKKHIKLSDNSAHQ